MAKDLAARLGGELWCDSVLDQGCALSPCACPWPARREGQGMPETWTMTVHAVGPERLGVHTTGAWRIVALGLTLTSPALAGPPTRCLTYEGPLARPAADAVRRRHPRRLDLEPHPGAPGEHRDAAARADLHGTVEPQDAPVEGALSLTLDDEARNLYLRR